MSIQGVAGDGFYWLFYKGAYFVAEWQHESQSWYYRDMVLPDSVVRVVSPRLQPPLLTVVY